jgi:2'-5' RNA ligase
VRWTDPATIHLTLRFLGEVGAERVAAVRQAVAEAAAASRPLELVVTGAGGFPSPRRPRVLWLGVGGEVAALWALAADLEARLAAIGLEPGARPGLLGPNPTSNTTSNTTSNATATPNATPNATPTPTSTPTSTATSTPTSTATAPFAPHLTLGRARSPRGAPALAPALAAPPGPPLPWRPDALVLFESHLDPGGARHLARLRAPRGGPER